MNSHPPAQRPHVAEKREATAAVPSFDERGEEGDVLTYE